MSAQGMARLRYRTYLFLLVSTVAAAPFVAFSLWESSRWKHFRLREADEQGALLANGLAREISEHLTSQMQLIESLARQVQARETMDAAVLQSIVTAQEITSDKLRGMGVANAAGVSVASIPIRGVGMDYRDRAYYTKMLKLKAPFFSEPMISKLGNEPVVATLVPLKDGTGHFYGYVYGSFALSGMNTIVERVNTPTRHVYVIDESGRTVAHRDPKARQQLKDLSGVSAFQLPTDGQLVRTGTDDRGVEVRATFAQVKIAGAEWRVVVAWDVDALEEQAAQTQRSGLLAAGLIILLALAAAAPLASGLTRPLSRIAEAAAKVGEGKLSHALPRLRWWEPQEVEVLVNSFQGMLTQLSDLVLALRRSKEEMLQAAGGLSRVMETQNMLMETQGDKLLELSRSAELVEEVSNISVVRAEDILRRARDAETLSSAGQASVESSLRGLNEIRIQTNALLKAIHALLPRTTEIGEITERVKDLADQSNVVAFNAAIQAMRAGEFGRGFDVVAQEMRLLANHSIASTVRIREILTNAESAILATAQSSEEGSERIQHGILQVQASGHRLKELSDIVEENASSTRDIANAVKRQHAGVTNMAEALEQLQQTMEETARVFEGADLASRSLLAAAERISTHVDAFRL